MTRYIDRLPLNTSSMRAMPSDPQKLSASTHHINTWITSELECSNCQIHHILQQQNATNSTTNELIAANISSYHITSYFANPMLPNSEHPSLKLQARKHLHHHSCCLHNISHQHVRNIQLSSTSRIQSISQWMRNKLILLLLLHRWRIQSSNFTFSHANSNSYNSNQVNSIAGHISK